VPAFELVVSASPGVVDVALQETRIVTEQITNRTNPPNL
jgi:hypothetical protein